MHLEGKAKEVFLSGRTQHIQTGIKQLKPDAHRALFIRSLSRLVFCTMRDTCADYLQCFGEYANSISTLSVWCMKETHSFGTLWIRFVVDRGVGGAVLTSELLSACLGEALSCVRLLEPFGVFLDKMLRKQLLASVVSKHEKFASTIIEKRINERLQKEDWYATPVVHFTLFEVSAGGSGDLSLYKRGNEPSSLLTPSAVVCARAVFALVADGLGQVPQELAQSIAQIGMSILERYFASITLRLDLPLNDQQLMGLIGNAVAFVNLVGTVRKKKKFVCFVCSC